MNTTRDYWILTACRIARPVLKNLAARTLHKNMPVEEVPGTRRARFAHMEALARSLSGLAPWLELNEAAAIPFAEQAREALDAATDPRSPDYWNCTEGQPLVEGAFLAQALLRAPHALWKPLDARVKRNVIGVLKEARKTKPPFNNWLLFAATVEAALKTLGEGDWDKMRIDYALRQHEQWYKGDGFYGDGPHFHADYYNSFVIQPMLIDIIRHVQGQIDYGWDEMTGPIWARAIRYAVLQERLISPEGTFPPTGRSLSYRFGVFHALAQIALLEKLPDSVKPAQVRCALTAVIRRMIEASGTFDENGWLRIGFCGAQHGTAEPYISTGSLYLCLTGLLPLGLPETAPFWSAPDEKWTCAKAWNGEAFPIDHAIFV